MPTIQTRFGQIYSTLIGLIMVALLAVVMGVIVARNVFGMPLFWSEDVTRVIFLWGVFLAMPLAVMRGHNIRVEILADRLPPAGQFWVGLACHLLVLVFLVMLFRYSLPLVELALRGRMLTTGWNNAVLRLPLTVGIGLCALVQLCELGRHLRAGPAGAGKE